MVNLINVKKPLLPIISNRGFLVIRLVVKIIYNTSRYRLGILKNVLLLKFIDK